MLNGERLAKLLPTPAKRGLMGQGVRGERLMMNTPEMLPRRVTVAFKQ
jgi:hypothetical protein